MMPDIRNSGVHSGVGRYLRLLAALLFLMTTINGIHCIAPAPAPQAQKFAIYNKFEADALNAIFNNWTEQTPQLTNILKWSLDKHPCTGSSLDYYDEGAWRGVFCTPGSTPLVSNTTGNYYEVSVTTFMLYGSNSRCGWEYNSQCGFDGINGMWPSEIGRLINLQNIWVDNHPGLTGPVPLEIWQLPNLTQVSMQNNSLTGQLGSNIFFANSQLVGIYLMYNNLSGRLELSAQGTFFCSSLMYLNVSYNQLNGPVDLRGLSNQVGSALHILDLSNNRFNGTFSTGSNFNPESLFLSNNAFTSIEFANYTGTLPRGSGTVYMPRLINLFVANNILSGQFPPEIQQMSNLQYLDLSGNNFSSFVDFTAKDNSWITHMKSLNLRNNSFFGIVDFRGTATSSNLRAL